MSPDTWLPRVRQGMGVATLRLITSYDGAGLRECETRVGAAVEEILNVQWPVAAGDLTGSGPWMLWRSPTERLVIAEDRFALQTLLEAFEPGRMDDACAIDVSDSLTISEIDPAALDVVAPRLCDPLSMPRAPGGTRLRWAEIAAVLLRLPDRRVLLLADAALDDYLAAWWQYAVDGHLPHDIESLRLMVPAPADHRPSHPSRLASG